jgi:hypothetical protein
LFIIGLSIVLCTIPCQEPSSPTRGQATVERRHFIQAQNYNNSNIEQTCRQVLHESLQILCFTKPWWIFLGAVLSCTRHQPNSQSMLDHLLPLGLISADSWREGD